MNLADLAKSRHSTKAFDETRKFTPQLVTEIETLLRYSPSSTNSQPWHFFIAESEAAKARVAKSAEGNYQFNADKIRDASLVVVFAAKNTVDDAYLEAILQQEASDGRFADLKAQEGQHGRRRYFVDKHRFELRDVQHWIEKQVFLALGTLLLGAAHANIDACPIEGFDNLILDEELGLRDKGLTSSVIVALGYRSEGDFNANLPKSRLPSEEVITRLD